MPSVFVIVVTYNGKEWYDRCFSSLKTSIMPVTTIVVDNASGDGTVEYIKANYPEIILIESGRNLGFGQANNRAIRYAIDHGCDYVFLLNQDAWIFPDTIKKMVDIAVCNSQYGVLSPIQLLPDENNINPGFISYITNREYTDETIIDDLYFGRLKQVYSTTSTNAASWLIDRKVIETIGGFDPIFFQYGEDDNFIKRVRYHNIHIGLCPLCKVCHAPHGSTIYDNQDKIDNIRFRNIVIIQLSDINKDISLRTEYFRHLLKGILYFIIRRKTYRYHLGIAKIIHKEKDKIKTSRNVNKQIGMHWL